MFKSAIPVLNSSSSFKCLSKSERKFMVASAAIVRQRVFAKSIFSAGVAVHIVKLLSALMLVGFLCSAYADQVPVEDFSQSINATSQNATPSQASASTDQTGTSDQDATTSGDNSAPTEVVATGQNQNGGFQPQMVQNLSMDDRVARLEQQMQNLTQMNVSQQFDEMRQQLQQLKGEVDQQQHAIQQLNDQLKSFYKDLSQRLQQQQNDGSKAKLVMADSSSDAGTVSQPAAQTETQSASDADHQAYMAGFNLLLAKKYTASIEKLLYYMHNYPNGKYIANAYYWLGEVYYVQGKYGLSLQQFQTVIDNYATSNKVAESKYKAAMIHAIQGKTVLAQRELTQLKKSLPADSSVAQLAAQQLKQMKGTTTN